jgi:dTDP-4-dehydrorhamnose 3,5-epimerase
VKFHTTPLPGVVVVEVERTVDARGYFARVGCEREFAAHGLPTRFVQSSISQNRSRGTVRGMHVQLAPSEEGKLVRCVRGAVVDVVVDLRPESPTYCAHHAIELSAGAANALYIPPRLAHGFQTLLDDSEILYQMTDYHAPDAAFGVRWNDPVFGILWPITDGIIIHPRDAAYPDFDPKSFASRARDAVPASASS